MSDDCDCGDCGDCDCGDCGDCGDCDCCDCDCSCDDCLPDNNFIVICCCIPPPSSSSDANKTNRGGTSSDCFPCCCCCNQRSYSPRRRRRERRKRRKKRGFCWRLWCCFAPNEPSPPPSPPRPRPDEPPPRGYMGDGRYPGPEDLDFYMRDRWAKDHDLDMPGPRGYKYGGRYPVHEEMRMYRDEYHGRGGRWTEPDLGSRGYYERDRWAKREDLGKAGNHSQGEKPSSSEELEMRHHDHRFKGKWSGPVKYEEPGRQTKN